MDTCSPPEFYICCGKIQLKRNEGWVYLAAPAQTTDMRSDVKLSRKTLPHQTTKPITFFPISMHNSSVFVFTTLQELTCHRSRGNGADISLSVTFPPPRISSIQPPHVQTRLGYYASSADRKHGTGKLKSQETKEVAGEWKNKRWLLPRPESGDVLRVISVSWYAAVRWWCAGQV